MKELFIATIFLTIMVAKTLASELQHLNTLINQHKYDQALSEINQIQDLVNTDILQLKISALKGLNRHHEAIPYQHALYTSDSTNIYFILELANGYMINYNYVQAINLYKIAQEKDPTNFYIHQQLGNAYFSSSQYKTAKEHYKACWKKEPTQYLNKQLGRIFQETGKLDSAIYHYKLALQQNPLDYQTVIRLTTILRQNEDYKEALSISDSYLSRNNNLRILRLNGHLQFITGNYKKAVQRYETSLALGDYSQHVLQYIGASFFHLNEYSKAIPFLENANLNAPSNIEICLLLSLCYIYTGEPVKAIYQLHEVIDIITPSPTLLAKVYQHLGESYTDINEHKLAIETYEEAIHNLPNDLRFHYFIAKLYDTWYQEPEKAMEYYEHILISYGHNEDRFTGMNHLLYDYIHLRVKQIKEEIFWSGN